MAELKYLLQRSLKLLKTLAAKKAVKWELVFQTKLNNQSVEETTLNIIYIPYHKNTNIFKINEYK